MARYTRTLTNFSGVDRETGRFNPAVEETDGAANTWGPESSRRQCVIGWYHFTTEGAPAEWTLAWVNPESGRRIQFDQGTNQSFGRAGGRQGWGEMPTLPDGRPFELEFVATGMDADGEFFVGYNIGNTESP